LIKKLIHIIILIAFIFISIISEAQIKSIGIPYIKNFPRSINNAGIQNWAISQDQNGFLYFANNDGVLFFNGETWDLIKVSSSSPVRSVLTDSKGHIYIGLINDFGILERKEPNNHEFKSLKTLLPEEFQDFEDIWRIFEVDDEIIFQCFKQLFLYKNDSITVIKPQKRFHFSFNLSNRFFVQEPGIGIFELEDGKLKKLPYWDRLKNYQITTIIELNNDDLLIGTQDDGVFTISDGKLQTWNTAANQLILKKRLYCAIKLSGNYIAFGTVQGGLVISDFNGKVIQILNTNHGLQNNTVLSLYEDRMNGLWLGLDNGIDYVETNSPISFIGSGKIGAGYCCKIFNDKLYIGTNQGLYVKSFDRFNNNNEFELVENTGGQVWSLEAYDGELICGHNLGTFLINEKSAKKISTEEGAWKYIRLKDNPDILIGGHYHGLVLLKKESDHWEFYKKIKGFNESSRYLFHDKYGNIWIGHGGKGIFRLSLNNELDSVNEVHYYSVNQGLPSTKGNILFRYNKELYVSNRQGIFQYDKISDTFLPSIELNKIFNDCGKLKVVVEDDSGNIWFIADKESGVILQNEDKTYAINYEPFKELNNKYINEFEFIYPYNKENVFIAIENGFAHYSLNISKSYKRNFSSFISKVELPYADSTVFLYNNKQENSYIFPFKNNSFRFYFAAPYFENEIPLYFSYFLEGFSNEWSDWSPDNYKDFTNLHEGQYLFKLKAKNIYEVESSISGFQFSIAPPWYRSGNAYVVYFILFAIIVFSLTLFIRYRIKRSRIKEEQKHQMEIRKKEEQFKQEALISEKEIIALRNEKLKADMVHRDKELANQTMAIIQKNKFLIKISEDLKGVQEFIINKMAKTKIKNLNYRVQKEIDIKRQNKLFETYFDEVHEDFFRRLKEMYPDLSANDLRICAFVKMNLTTQEIAAMLNISYRGAEISRYRLRKKLNLNRSTNLSTFLTQI